MESKGWIRHFNAIIDNPIKAKLRSTLRHSDSTSRFSEFWFWYWHSELYRLASRTQETDVIFKH